MSGRKGFTPGPWRIERDNYGVERIWDSELDCDIACCEGDGSIPKETRQANARLIASAPDLVAVLEAIPEAVRNIYLKPEQVELVAELLAKS